jgi:hypothetical protein
LSAFNIYVIAFGRRFNVLYPKIKLLTQVELEDTSMVAREIKMQSSAMVTAGIEKILVYGIQVYENNNNSNEQKAHYLRKKHLSIIMD